MTCNIPKLRMLPFESQIIKMCKHQESLLGEAFIAMSVAGMSVRLVEDITVALWGDNGQRRDAEQAEPEGVRPHREGRGGENRLAAGGEQG